MPSTKLLSRHDIPEPQHRKWKALLTGDWTHGDIWTTIHDGKIKGEFFIRHDLSQFGGDTEAPVALLKKIAKLYKDYDKDGLIHKWKVTNRAGEWWLDMWDMDGEPALTIEVWRLIRMENVDDINIMDPELPYYEAYFHAISKERFKCNICKDVLDWEAIRDGRERCKGCVDAPATTYQNCVGCNVMHPVENLTHGLLCNWCNVHETIEKGETL